MNRDLNIGGTRIAPGSQQTVNLPIAPLYTHTQMTMPVRVIHGKKDGPHLFVCAAIHGDEINGVEIIHRLLKLQQLKRLRGTLLAVPVVNVYGYTTRTRYLPDRRDLNRSFPGSAKGSMAARLAHLFMEEIVANATHGIDLHSGAVQRRNLPHIRTQLDDAASFQLARAFHAPVILNSDLRDGSLREAVSDRGMPFLLYEGGEALRFDERTIQAGVRGVLSVMRTLGMLPRDSRRKKPEPAPEISRESRWVRAPESGTLVVFKPLGSAVEKDDILGVITNPLGEYRVDIAAPVTGVVIGQTVLPLAYEGEALFNIACLDPSSKVADHLQRFYSDIDTFTESGAMETNRSPSTGDGEAS